MTSNFKVYKPSCILTFCLLNVFLATSQNTSTFKAQVALGVNLPSESGFVEGFEGQSLNFPTVNLGLQYMFKQRLGVKLDYGFNRISNEDNTTEFKVNYSRINAQLVYDASKIMGSISPKMGFFVHAGPGYSMIRPLGNYTENDTNFFNAMAGAEIHYGISDKLSMYVDLSYIHSFDKDFEPITEGYGSFNGNLLTITIGASISLSGCYYCE